VKKKNNSIKHNRHTKKKSHKKSHVRKKKNETSSIEMGINKTLSSNIFSIIGDVLFYLFFLLLISGAIVFNFNDSPDKSFFGYRFMTVLTDSMSPNPKKPEYKDGFKSGSIIILKQANPKELDKGDIITFYPVKGNTDAYLTHRIIETKNELDGQKGLYFVTQGDANTGSDIPIESKQVVGKVILSIPFLGRLLDYVRSNIAVVAVFVSLLFGFIIMLKYYLSINSITMENKKNIKKEHKKNNKKHKKKKKKK